MSEKKNSDPSCNPKLTRTGFFRAFYISGPLFAVYAAASFLDLGVLKVYSVWAILIGGLPWSILLWMMTFGGGVATVGTVLFWTLGLHLNITLAIYLSRGRETDVSSSTESGLDFQHYGKLVKQLDSLGFTQTEIKELLVGRGLSEERANVVVLTYLTARRLG